MAEYATYVDCLVKGFHAACCLGNYVCDGVSTLLHLNYLMVSSVFGAVTYSVAAVKTLLWSVAVAAVDILHMSMEIWKELVNIAGVTFNAGAGFGRYLVLGMGTSVKWIGKTLLPWIWNGLIKLSLAVWKGCLFCWNAIASTFCSAAVAVSDTVQVCSKMGGDAVVTVAEGTIENLRNMISAFNFFCNTAMTYCLEIWVTVVILVSQIYETLIKKIITFKDFIVTRSLDLWSKLPSISSDVYVLVSLGILTYFVSILVFRHLDSRGFTFPSWRQQHRNLGNILEESDAENLGDDDDDDTGISDSDGHASDSDHESVAGSVGSHVSVASNHSHHSNISNGRYNLRQISLPLETTDALNRALEQERDRRRCVVCQDQAKNVLLLPCRHMCMCGPCAQTITRTALIYRRICPLCRAPIEAIMSVFV
ncbi:uncharacterized protein LOC135501077 [Lineus longissimus]|uniref:uncharacterized protein LOC135501077 n=1 Tax=Lineus longissimus TaxID=88925 RepID=UPI00315D6B1F